MTPIISAHAQEVPAGSFGALVGGKDDGANRTATFATAADRNAPASPRGD